MEGWEGLAADGRILRDALNRRYSLKVPHGYYYLVDAGYTNCEGFLTPYRGQRYHLNEWRDGRHPVSPEEFFNMKHSASRNVIERFFGLLKMRWKILWSTCCYGIDTHIDIITACCLLHNLIRKEMQYDPLEVALNDVMEQNAGQGNDEENYIDVIEPSNE
ncbi:uncharacterized protein LOC131183108 [Hevea brasiliensis]|uniref:uncharacterized protein LOC131183108 n=1 Tax=Hevea brasiliensis TaxID=3981 RepID=UPI0026005EBB|nr:uncharacterized protein LOC131183108 [Hevea brasiliensis]